MINLLGEFVYTSVLILSVSSSMFVDISNLWNSSVMYFTCSRSEGFNDLLWIENFIVDS